MKVHFKISVDPLKESTSVTAECGYIVPNVYFPVIYVPGSLPESANSVRDCGKCWDALRSHVGAGKVFIYGLLERREAKKGAA